MSNNEVGRNLERLSKSLNSKYLKPAMAKACGIVRNDAIKGAPQKTGNLKRSIDFEVAEDGTEGVIYSNVAYAPYVACGA